MASNHGMPIRVIGLHLISAATRHRVGCGLAAQGKGTMGLALTEDRPNHRGGEGLTGAPAATVAGVRVATKVRHRANHHHGVHSTGLHIGLQVEIRVAMLRRSRFQPT